MAQSPVSLQFVLADHVYTYVLKLIEAKRSHSYINLTLSALRFWLLEVARRRDLPYPWTWPKKEKKLPVVLSPQEVLSIFKPPQI
ncbi:site-specific integrase [Paenibacillus durus]|uniref:Integrase SAM-like N-terminal domain-containing protein n=1 Tax=Paenibacillus durus TaxID=44251 RepID=A0A089HXE0_PAEDU|nr:hypothetical protein [Paenibacillus durus]AIQ15028.1 hypothetical protein PDUR_26500 [Paenibacillus durus]